MVVSSGSKLFGWTPPAAKFGTLVSRGRTMTASSSSGSNLAALSVDDNYNSIWQANASLPQTLDMDVTGLDLGIVAYEIFYIAENYRSGINSQDMSPMVGAVALQVDTGSGYNTVASFSGNDMQHRVLIFDATGATSIRLSMTADAEGGTTAPQVQVNLWATNGNTRASNTALDFGLSINGDSIPASCTSLFTGFFSDPTTAIGDQVFDATGKRTLQINNGMPGYNSAQIVSELTDILAVDPCKRIAIVAGSNDAIQAVAVNTYRDNLIAGCAAIIAAGAIAVIPTVIWSRGWDVTPYNAVLSQVFASDSRIIAGPDLYAYFFANQTYISGDNVHPTASGAVAYRTQWVNWAIAQGIY